MLDIQSKPKTLRKRCVRTVDLRFFQDNATGNWGVTHKDTQGDDGFNAIWSAQMLFHDSFEHAHEHTNRFFRGDFAMNVGGEMAAMGAMWYYYDQLGLYERLTDGSIYSPGDRMRQSTQGECESAIYDGYGRFGQTLTSNVPRQRPTDNSELECQIALLVQKVKEYQKREYHKPDEVVSQAVKEERDRERQYGEDYRKSVTFRRVADLHRYGYRMAERLVPNTYENCETLREFWQFWDDFCKRNPAEEMAQYVRGITVKVYRKGNEVSWKAWANLQYGAKVSKVLLTNNFGMDDLYSLFAQD